MAARARVEDIRSHFQQVLADTTDPKQIEPMTAFVYAQVRSQRELVNLRIATADSLNAVLQNPLIASEQLMLLIKLGTTSAEEMIADTRRWKDELADMTQIVANQGAANDAVITDLRTQLSMATADIQRMEAQLNTLYEEREKLERELGRSDADEIIAAFRAQCAK